MAATTIDLTGSPKRRRREHAVRLFFLAAALSSIAISVLLIIALVGKAYTFLTHIELTTLWSSGWYPRRGEYDIKTLFMGTLIVTGIAMLIAAPLGLLSAIFVSEYATPRVRRIVKPVLEILAGIPSVVLGFFALTWISPEVVQRYLDPTSPSFSLAAAGIAVGILVTPLVAAVSEDALRAVPRTLREASYGLGAKKATTSLRVVLPAAVSGIVASLILAISRAIGETMIVFIAAGASGGALFNADPFRPGQTVTSAMASLASGSDQVAVATGTGAGQAVNSLYFLGLLLFVVTLGLNLVGNFFVRRVRNRY